MAQMAKVVDRDAAAVDARLAGGQRDEWLGAACEGIGEPQRHSCLEAAAEATACLAKSFQVVVNAVEEQKPGDVMALDRRVDDFFASSNQSIAFRACTGRLMRRCAAHTRSW